MNLYLNCHQKLLLWMHEQHMRISATPVRIFQPSGESYQSIYAGCFIISASFLQEHIIMFQMDAMHPERVTDISGITFKLQVCQHKDNGCSCIISQIISGSLIFGSYFNYFNSYLFEYELSINITFACLSAPRPTS